MVGHELHTGCPHGEDHRGDVTGVAAGVEKSGRDNKEIGRYHKELKSWIRIRIQIWAMALK